MNGQHTAEASWPYVVEEMGQEAKSATSNGPDNCKPGAGHFPLAGVA